MLAQGTPTPDMFAGTFAVIVCLIMAANGLATLWGHLTKKKDATVEELTVLRHDHEALAARVLEYEKRTQVQLDQTLRAITDLRTELIRFTTLFEAGFFTKGPKKFAHQPEENLDGK